MKSEYSNTDVANKLDQLYRGVWQSEAQMYTMLAALSRLRQSDEITDAAKDIFDTFAGLPNLMHSTKWANLGTALYGSDDERVKALQPKPEYDYGTWVVASYKFADETPFLIVSKDSVYYSGYQVGGGYRCVAKSACRPATDAEIAKAKNG